MLLLTKAVQTPFHGKDSSRNARARKGERERERERVRAKGAAASLKRLFRESTQAGRRAPPALSEMRSAGKMCNGFGTLGQKSYCHRKCLWHL